MRLGVVLVVLATIALGPAWAEVERTANLAEQSKEIERQLALIQEQKKRIESQDGGIKALQQQLADQEQTLLSLKRRLDELEAAGAPPGTATGTAAQAEEQPSNPELPADVVSAGDFPGSIRIPGSDAAVKFGALIRTAFVFTLQPLVSDTSFLTWSIPVGTVPAGDGARTAFTANTSLSLVKTPSALTVDILHAPDRTSSPRLWRR